MFELYTLPQWLMFFFIYCFIGWVWESCYVSVKKGKWVNRGFLHGPFLPIYGSGMIVILISTAPVRGNLFYIFLFGMVGSTILEYCTGSVMEKLFHVRYWDYSDKPFNLNGHICLFVSLGWGIGSIFLVHFAHVPIEHLVLWVPERVLEIATFAITVGFTIDFTQSFNEAMDLRATLEKLSKSNEQIRMLEKRIEVIVAFGEDTYQRYRKMMEENSFSTKSRFIENVQKMWEIKDQKLAELEQQARKYFKENTKDKQEEGKYMALFAEAKRRMGIGSEKEYKRLGRILKRNPDAVSLHHNDAMKEMKEMLKSKN